jgi:hypothetical protein|tara:strand:- start:486 stop:626 length:141 start_codon:yes stop_codon:yes gene_type:complete
LSCEFGTTIDRRFDACDPREPAKPGSDVVEVVVVGDFGRYNVARLT